MSDFLKRYVDSAGIDPNDPTIPQTIRDRLTGADAPAFHSGEELDRRRLGRSWGEKTASAVTQDLYGQRHLVAALGNYLAGDKEDGLARLKRWEENNQRVREIGPEAQDFGEIEDFQTGASVIGYQTAKLIPDMILGLGVGGLAKKAATTTATTAAAKLAAKKIAESTVAKEAKEALVKTGLEKLKDTAGYKAADAAKREALERGRMQQIREQTDDAALDAARKNLSPAALKAIKAKGDTAFAVGATVGSIPSNLQEQGNFMVKHPELDRGEALKLLAGTTASASTDFLPLAGWLNRFSKKSIDASRSADKFVTRLAKAVATQARDEGGQEAVQAFITRGSQQWVDDNIGMFDQEAMQEYYMNFIAGAVMGGVMGGSAEVGISSAQAIDSAFTGAYKKLEAQRLRMQNKPSDPNDPTGGGGAPPIDPSSPTSNVASAAAAAQASGRTLNPIAASVLQNDTGGDLGSQIKFSQVADQQAMNSLNEFKNRVKNYRGSKEQIADAYDNDASQELFPVGIRLDQAGVFYRNPETGKDDIPAAPLPFANIAAGFGFTGFQGDAFALKAQPEYKPGMLALEAIMRYGYDSDNVSDEQRSAYNNLAALAPEPWRFSAVIALRSLNPTLHRNILDSVNDRLAKADQDLAKEEANLAESNAGQAVDSVTAPLDSEEGNNLTDDNMVGANPDAASLSNNMSASLLNQGLTAETTANALAARLKPKNPNSKGVSNADLLLSSEFEPVVLKNVFGNPGVISKLGGNKAVSDAYARLQSIADRRARLMARNADNLDQAGAAKKKAQIDKGIEAMIAADPVLRKIANGVRSLAQKEADALVTKETEKKSGTFKNYNQEEFDARKTGAFGEAPYIQTQDPNVLIDLDNQMRRFVSSPDGQEERMYIEGKNPDFDLANMAGNKNEQTNDPVGAPVTEQNSLQMLARLATNPDLPIDWASFNWNATGTADGTPIRFREKSKTRKKKHKERKEAAARWSAEQKAKNTESARGKRADRREELAEKAAEARAKSPPPNKKGVSYNSSGVNPDELKDTENQDTVQISNGDLASNDPTTGKVVISEVQKYNPSGFIDDAGESYNPNSASERMTKLMEKIRKEAPQVDVLRFFASFKNPDGTSPYFYATQFRWSETAEGWVVFRDKEQLGKVLRSSLTAKQLKYLENPALAAFDYYADNPEKQHINVPTKDRPKSKLDRDNLIREILTKAISADASPRSITQQTKKIDAMTAAELDAAFERIMRGDYDTGRNKVVEEQPQKFKDVTKKTEFDEDPSSADDIRSELFDLAEEVGATKKAVFFVLNAAEDAGTAPTLKTSASRLAAGVQAVRAALEKIKNDAYRNEISTSIARMAGKLPPSVNKYKMDASMEGTVFSELPSYKPGQKTMRYAGVGSRETPPEMIALMTQAATFLESKGYTLLSGGAKGADSAFEKGAKSKKQVFYAKHATPETIEIAKEIHPNPGALKEIPLRLMARNTFQVFGRDLDAPVDFVLAWTPDGAETAAQRTRATGGTGQAIEMASRKNVPVINMANPNWKQRLKAIVDAQNVPATFEIVKPEDADVSGMRAKGKNITNTEPNEDGWLGNPFVADDVNPNSKYTRGKATEAFEKVFLKRIAEDPNFKEAVLALRGKKVGYYKPDKEHVHLRVVQKWLADQPLPGQQAKPNKLIKTEKSPSLPRTDPKERASLQKSDTMEKAIEKALAEAAARKKANAIAKSKEFIRSQDPIKVQALVKEALVEAKPNELQRLLSAWLSKRWANTHGAAPVFKVAKKDQKFKGAPLRDTQTEVPRAKGELESTINTAKQRLAEFNIRPLEKAPKVEKPVNKVTPRTVAEETVTDPDQRATAFTGLPYVVNKKIGGKLVTTRAGQKRIARVASRREALAKREQKRRDKLSPVMQQLEAAWRNHLEKQAAARAQQKTAPASIVPGEPTAVINALNATGFSEAGRIAGLLEKALRTLPKGKAAAMQKEIASAVGKTNAERFDAKADVVAKYYSATNDLYQKVFNRYKDEIEFALSKQVKASLPEPVTAKQARDQRSAGRKRLIAARNAKALPGGGLQFNKDGTPVRPVISPVTRIEGGDPRLNAPTAKEKRQQAAGNVTSRADGPINPLDTLASRDALRATFGTDKPLEANDPELKASVAADWEQRPITDAEQKKTVAAYVKGMSGLIGAKGAEALVKSGAVTFVTRDNLPPFATHIGNGVQAYEYEGRIYILADAPVGNVAGVLLHESFHAFGKSLLGEDYIPLLTELSRIAGVAAPVARTSTIMESQLGQRLPLTPEESKLFDQALESLPKDEQKSLKDSFNSDLGKKQRWYQRDLINLVFEKAGDTLLEKANAVNTVPKTDEITPVVEQNLFKAISILRRLAWENDATREALDWSDQEADAGTLAIDASNESRTKRHNDIFRAVLREMGVDHEQLFNDDPTTIFTNTLMFLIEGGVVDPEQHSVFKTYLETHGKKVETTPIPYITTALLHRSDAEWKTAIREMHSLVTGIARVEMRSETLDNFLPESPDINTALVQRYAGLLIQTKNTLSPGRYKPVRPISYITLVTGLAEFASSRNTSLIAAYNKAANSQMQQFIAYTTDDGGTWRKHPQAKSGTQEHAVGVASVQTNSHTGWCIARGMAVSYLTQGDIWLFNTADGSPRLAIRFVGKEIDQIQEPANDRSVSGNGEQRLIELAKTGLIDKDALLKYAVDWNLIDVVTALGTADDVANAKKKAGYARDAAQNGLLAAWEAEADVQAAEFAAGDFLGPEEENNQRADGPQPDNADEDFDEYDALEHERAELAAAGLGRNAAGEIVPIEDVQEERAQLEREQAEARNRLYEQEAEQRRYDNDVPFSVAANADDLRAVVDRDWIAKAKLRIELAGVKPEHQAEEFAAYAIENYESAPNNIQKWVDKVLGKMKLALATMLRKLKVAPKYRVALLSDPAVLREIALKGLRVAARRSEGHTNYGAGSIMEDLAVTAQAAVTRVFGVVYGSVQSERIAAGAQQFATSPTRGYQDPGMDPDELLKLDVYNLNEFLNRALTPAQRQALYQLAHTTFRETIRTLQPERYAQMLSNEYGREYTLYNLFQAYMGGALGEQSEIRGFYLLNKAKAKAREFLDIYTEDDLALQVLKDMSDGTLVNASKSAYPYDPELRLKRNQSKAGSISQTIAETTAKVGDAFERAFYSDYDRARSSGIPAYEEIVNRIQYRSGDTLEIRPDGTVNRGMLPAVQHTIGKYLQKYEKAVEGLHAESVARVQREGYYNLPEPRPGSLTPAETEAFHKLRAVNREIGKYAVEAGVLTAEQVANNPDFSALVFDVGGNVAVHKQKLFEVFFQHRRKTNGKLEFKYEEMLDGLFVKKNPAKAGETQEHFDKLSFEQQKAFVRSVVEYPFFDASEVMLDNQLGREFRHASHRLFTEVFANYKKGDTADLDVLVSTLEPSLGEMAVRYIEPLVVRAEFNKAFPGNKAAELIQEMVDQGATPVQINAAGRIIDAAQHKFTFYPLDAQGRKGSPTIAKLNKTLAIKLHNRETLTAIQNVAAWNNLRMLPLSLLSSLVDPQGIAIRSGGDLGIAFTALRKGMAAAFDAKAQAELQALADAVGYHAELSAAQALHEGFGAGSRTPLARRINSFLFKWNGLEWYTRQSRFMGIIAGHLALAKWQEAARDPNTTPEKQTQVRRYLGELGLKVDDVRVGTLPDGPLAGQKQVLLLNEEQRKNASPEQLAADDRVKAAIVQFADEALLRPNILQTPGYFKDPFVSLFVQYKHFSYALYEQIVRRMQIEIANGNFAVLNAALSYLPFILVAELLREFIQWGPDGNPQRAQWGVPEYAGLAVAKTGFAGPRIEYAAAVQRDAERGNVPGISALGPTVGTLGEVKDSATGQRSWGSTLQSMLPGSAVYKRWDDQPGGGGGDGGLTRKTAD